MVDSNAPENVVPHNLRPIFRDREELAVGNNLGVKIEAALKASRNLIVVCSPNAAQSHWVNEEVLFFKRNNRGANIFCVIVDGEPFASKSNSPENECFPENLRIEFDANGELTDRPAEPLAADLRETADGKRLGLLKLISGMAGLGVNDLVQRDLQRARKRVTAITASAATIVLAMGLLTWAAVHSQQEAEKRRNDAEGQIEFMLTDLKEKLDSVGRLDALEAVGNKAASYYDDYPISAHDDDALGRRARVFHYLGEVQDNLGNLKEADTYFRQAYEATRGLLVRNPNAPDYVFNHAQSTYWVARLPWKREQFKDVEYYYGDYKALANKLYELEPMSARSLEELGYANSNLGSLYYKTGQAKKAQTAFQKALNANRELLTTDPKNLSYQLELANTLAWLSDSHLFDSSLATSIQHRENSIVILEGVLKNFPLNFENKYKLMISRRALARLFLLVGDADNAEINLSIADRLKHDLLKHEPKNMDWLKEVVQLDLLKVEYLFLIEEKETASQLLKEIEANLSLLSQELSLGDKHVNRVSISFEVMKIYELIAMDRAPEAKKKLIAFDELTLFQAAELKDRPELIDIRVLQYLLLSKEIAIRDIIDLCMQHDLRLSPTYMSKISVLLRSDEKISVVKDCDAHFRKLDYGGADIIEWAQTKLQNYNFLK